MKNQWWVVPTPKCVMETESLHSNAVVLLSFLRSAMEVVAAETAIVAANSIAWSLWMMETLLSETKFLPIGTDFFGRFPFSELHAVEKPGPENKDGSDTEDDEEDDDDDAADDPDEEGEEEEDEEDGSGDEGEDEGDPEDEPEANGDGGSGDEDDEDDDDNDDGEEEEGEEDEEDEDEEEIPQPPTKKRK